MEKQNHVIPRLGASQASGCHKTLPHGCLRQIQQASFFPYSPRHQHQRFQVILLFMFYFGSTMLCAATSLGSSLSLAGPTTLHWNETLVSSDGQFTVGFYGSDIGYNLAIWYTKVPIVTPVWMPDTSIVVSNKAVLSLSEAGVLQVQEGLNVVWASPTNLGNGINATIVNTGSLILLNNKKNITWQSFDFPTNTLLPNQHYSSKSAIVLYSWKDERNYSEGPYSFKWNTSNRIELWYSTQWNHEVSTPHWNYSFVLTKIIGNISTSIDIMDVFLTSDGEFQATIEPNIYNIIGKSGVNGPNHLRRMTLDSDGNLRMYSWQIGISKVWNEDWEALSNTCEIYGMCGEYAVCVGGQCQCPKGFYFSNPTNKTEGCLRIKDPSFCNKTEIPDDFEQLPADFPYGYDFMIYSNVTLEYCQQSCIDACECQCATVSIPDENGFVQCWLKSNPLLNGRFQGDKISYLRMAPNLINRKREKLSYSTARLIILIGGPIMFTLGIISCIFCYTFICKRFKYFLIKNLEVKWITAHGQILKFTFGEIKLMTNNFAEEIGRGGYGTVFKGEIGYEKATKTIVAVKRLDKLDVGEKEFINEIDIIGRIHHANLVHLLGYCAEKNQKLLIYEYMEQSSLDKILFDKKKHKTYILDWHIRFNIAIQVAKGLAYLHNDVREQRIIHCDIKPENILLDSMFCAKVADFGMSRIMKREKSITTTREIHGTFGYLAPEWTFDQISITPKIDVYSYGMVLLEIVGGRRNLKANSSQSDDISLDWYFPLWAYSKINDRNNMFEVLDPLLFGLANPFELERALRIAFWCINDRPHLRPPISMVIQMLEGHIPIELPVPQPEFLLDMLTSFQNDDNLDIGIHEIFKTSTKASENIETSSR